MPHSPFGWSYPPGCSGPPEHEAMPCKKCGHADEDHDWDDDAAKSLHCLVEGCDCKLFVESEPELDPPGWEEGYDPIELRGDDDADN